MTVEAIEASHALQRAAVALEDVASGGRDNTGLVPLALAPDTTAQRAADDLAQSIVLQVFELGLLVDGVLESVRDPAVVDWIHGAVDLLDVSVRQIQAAAFERARDGG